MGTSPAAIFVKQFRVPSSARAESFVSYCVFDRVERQALILDPHQQAIGEYVDFLSSQRLSLALIVESQLHYSHPSAARALALRFEAPIGMSSRTLSESADRKLSDGDELKLGEARLVVIQAPGVRRDSLCLYGAGTLFTGETLWAGAASALGYEEADVSLYFRSVADLKKEINPETIVFPGFDVNALAFSRWSVELVKNPDLIARDESSCQRLKGRFPIRFSEDLARFAAYNSSKSGETQVFHKAESPFRLEQLDSRPQGYTTISPEKLEHKLSSPVDLVLLDVREPEEFETGRIPGAIGVPISELPFRAEEFRHASRVYLCCQSGRRSSLSASTLSYLGFNDVIVVNGGFLGWQNAGLPVEK